MKHYFLRKLHMSVFKLAEKFNSFSKKFHKINCLKYLFQPLFIENTYYGKFWAVNESKQLGELYSHVTLTTVTKVRLPKHEYILNTSFYIHKMKKEKLCINEVPITEKVLIVGEKPRNNIKKFNQQEKESFNSGYFY